jgi:hypothetical protein
MLDPLTPDEDDEPPDDDSSEEYREAAEAVLQRLMNWLQSFNGEADQPVDALQYNDPQLALAPGALYSVRGSVDGAFQVMKVLATDTFGVHVCLYGNAFAHRPTTIAPDLLDTAPFISVADEDADGEWPLSVGHLPLLITTFLNMQPVFIARTEVIEDELEGYLEWQQAGGGYI